MAETVRRFADDLAAAYLDCADLGDPGIGAVPLVGCVDRVKGPAKFQQHDLFGAVSILLHDPADVFDMAEAAEADFLLVQATQTDTR